MNEITIKYEKLVKCLSIMQLEIGKGGIVTVSRNWPLLLKRFQNSLKILSILGVLVVC